MSLFSSALFSHTVVNTTSIDNPAWPGSLNSLDLPHTVNSEEKKLLVPFNILPKILTGFIFSITINPTFINLRTSSYLVF